MTRSFISFGRTVFYATPPKCVTRRFHPLPMPRTTPLRLCATRLKAHLFKYITDRKERTDPCVPFDLAVSTSGRRARSHTPVKLNVINGRSHSLSFSLARPASSNDSGMGVPTHSRSDASTTCSRPSLSRSRLPSRTRPRGWLPPLSLSSLSMLYSQHLSHRVRQRRSTRCFDLTLVDEFDADCEAFIANPLPPPLSLATSGPAHPLLPTTRPIH